MQFPVIKSHGGRGRWDGQGQHKGTGAASPEEPTARVPSKLEAPLQGKGDSGSMHPM